MEQEALVFVTGLATLLGLPLLGGLCVAWCCCRYHLGADGRRRRRELRGAFVEALPTSEGEDDDPESCTSTSEEVAKECASRMSGAAAMPSSVRSENPEDLREPMCRQNIASQLSVTVPKLTKVCFRKADWRSRQRRPIVLELALEHVRTVTDLSLRLRHAHRQRVGSHNASCVGSEDDTDGDLGAITIECQHWDGQMAEIIPGMDLDGLSEVRALFVTTNLSQAVLLPRGGAVVPAASPLDDDQQSEALVDFSLAGCCGVQSTGGGLRITSSVIVSDADEARARRDRLSELSRFRAAKFRHYLTL